MSQLSFLERRTPGAALHPLLRRPTAGIAQVNVQPSAEVLARILAALRRSRI
jgi:hypothetical protein